MKTYAIMTLGCKVNDFESNYIKEQMDLDYKEVSFKEKADIYIIFTCCVTNMAESKSRKFLHQARRNNPDAFLVAVGCYSQTKGQEETFDDVDLVVGSKHKDKIKQWIDEGLKRNTIETLKDVRFEELMLHDYHSKSRAFLKIQDGCNQYCSYCIIPYARGRERSSDHNTVLKQAEELSKHSSEIVLTGIHTGRYFDGEYHLVDLLKELLTIDRIKTIRLSSIEITEITDEMIDLLSSTTRIAHHLHIPLQAGSDHILSLMHRPYDTEGFIKRVEEIRRRVPGISVSTDLIVGFPNESEEDFKMTLDFLKRISFSFIHVFPYSRKTGTVADQMDGHLNGLVKKERVKQVEECQKVIRQKVEEELIGRTFEVFVEKVDDTYSYGYAKEYFYIVIKGKFEVSKIVNVVVKEVKDGKIIGEYVTESVI